MFLWYVLLNDHSFGYNHRNDPDYQSWKKDAMKLAEENGELKAKLAAQEESEKKLEASGVAPNPAYMPAAFADDPVAALSDEAIESLPIQKPVMRVATGVPGGNYHRVGEKIKAKGGDKFEIVLVPTSGSGENLKMLKAGTVDAAIIQSDADFVDHEVNKDGYASKTGFNSGEIYSEYITLVVAKDSNISSVRDLKSGNIIYVGPDGSGTAITWKGIVLQNSKYETDPARKDVYKNVAVQNGSYEDALEKVKSDKNAAMLFVAGSDAPLLERASRDNTYKLVPVDDAALTGLVDDQGKEVYDALTLVSTAYPKLQSGELQTLSVDAMWTVSDAWVKKFGEEATDLVSDAVIDTIADLHITSLAAAKPVEEDGVAAAGKGGLGWWWLVIILVVGGVAYWVIVIRNRDSSY